MTPGCVDPAFRIISDEAAVVSGDVACWNCRAPLDVICIYCQTGFVDGEPMLDFSVSNITHIGESLRRQLTRWPKFYPPRRQDGGVGAFANHCGSCGKPQDDFYLHCQPGGVFFSLQDPRAQNLRIHALYGQVRLSGDEGLELG